MFKAVDNRVNIPEMEERVLAFWKENDIFRKSVAQRAGAPLFVVYEGPPTANGTPGIHHVLARVFKDIVPRYKTMQGFQSPRKGGWDTHGLPVELEVERELGLHNKREIEEYGIEQFNQKCRESVFRYVRQWEAMTDRIGFWIDMENAYVTFRNEYIETGWWIIKQLWDRGLVYRDYKTTPHCPRCGTSLSSHEVALGYKDDTPDPSVYVKFELDPEATRAAGKTLPDALVSNLPTYLLAWTTTPWTLPGNAALGVAPEAQYAVIELEDLDGRRQRMVLAEALRPRVVQDEHRVVAFLPGADLIGLRYKPLYSPADVFVNVLQFTRVDGRSMLETVLDPPEPWRYPVIGADFVSIEDGTGIVHVAPSFGEVDHEAGRQHGLYFIQPVALDGTMTIGLGKADPAKDIAGRFVKDADPRIIEDLKERGLLYRRETIKHTYPFCWRCDTPLLYYAKPSWYFRTTELRQKLIDGNAQIHWYPEHIREGRYGDWLENNVDWAISRERYWGTPIPIWQCERCEGRVCIGSRAELVSQPGVAGFRPDLDLHRPYVDAVTFACERCGGTMRRIPEVMDAWFDSGAMPYAQWHYPFENQETFRRWFPADFICEGVDQTRGWFYTLHAEATLLNAARPDLVPESIAYRHVISLGHILDGKGEKMSKSRGNVVDPWTIINRHGADAIRWYLYTASPAGNPRRFSEDLVGESLRKFLLTLWNTYSFFVTYANIDNYIPGRASGTAAYSDLDRWVLSELARVTEEVTTALEAYNPTDAARALQGFVDDLSNWYVRRSRRRFWRAGMLNGSESGDLADKLAAYDTLYTALVTVAKLLAPFTPFMAEELYQNLVRSVDPLAPESVHLTEYPDADVDAIDEELSRETRLVMRVVSLGRAARNKAGVKVRQPLQALLVKPRTADEGAAVMRHAAQIADELNVLEVQLLNDAADVAQAKVVFNTRGYGNAFGRDLPQLLQAVETLDPAGTQQALQSRETVRVGRWEVPRAALSIEYRPQPGYAVAAEAGYLVAVTTEVTPELAAAGLARELVHRLQTMRRSAGFDIADTIAVYYQGDPDMARVLTDHKDYVSQETLARDLIEGAAPDGYTEEQDVDGHRVRLTVRKLS